MISAEKARTPVSVACGLLGVCRSGYYDWARRAPSDRALTDAWLIEKIRAIHAAHRGVYGSPRDPRRAAARARHPVARKRVERLMRAGRASRAWCAASAAARRSACRASASPTTWSSASSARERRTCSGSPTSPTCGPGRAGSTSPPSRTPTRGRIVGWSMADHMRSELVVDALQMAVAPPAARARTDPPLRPGHRNTSRWPSARPPATPASRARWAPRATPTTTPSPRASSPRSRRSSCTAAPGRPARELIGEVFEYIEAFYNRDPPALHARLPLARGLREQNPQRPRFQPRRFAAQRRGSGDLGSPGAGTGRRFRRGGVGRRATRSRELPLAWSSA